MSSFIVSAVFLGDLASHLLKLTKPQKNYSTEILSTVYGKVPYQIFIPASEIQIH